MITTYFTSASGRDYWIDANGIAHRDERLPQEVLDAQADAEIFGEFAMSWVCGGGRPEDAAAAYRQFT